MVAFPPPPVTLRQRSSTFAEPLRSLRRVLSKGYHPFLSEWLEKVSQPSLAEPFGSDSGVTRISSRLLLLSLGPHDPFAVPLSVSKAVTSVTGALYSYASSRSNFCVFYFQRVNKKFVSVMGVNAPVGQPPGSTHLTCFRRNSSRSGFPFNTPSMLADRAPPFLRS